MNLDEFQKFQDRISRLQREADQSAGAYKQLMEQLLDEFGTKTLKQARRLIRKMKLRAKRSDRKYRRARDEFEEKFGDRL